MSKIGFRLNPENRRHRRYEPVGLTCRHAEANFRTIRVVFLKKKKLRVTSTRG